MQNEEELSDDLEEFDDITLKEFLSQIKDQNDTLRQQIQASSIGLSSDPTAIVERRRRVLRDNDFHFFSYTYFPHYIPTQILSRFQKHFCELFPQLLIQKEGCTEWWIAPRGEGKTTFLSKIGIIWIVVQSLLNRAEVRAGLGLENNTLDHLLDYIILLGAETTMAAAVLEAIKTELTANPALQLDFPEIIGKGKKWIIGEIISRTNVKIKSFGAGKAIRGTTHGASRVEVVIADDLITDDESTSQKFRDSRWNWYTKAVLQTGHPSGRLKAFAVATVLHKDDPVSRAKKSMTHLVHHFRAIEKFPARMDLWEQCEALMRNNDATVRTRELSNKPSYKFYTKHQKRMDKGAVTSWPEMRSLYLLMRERADSPVTFASEKQGEPRDPETQIFKNITFWVRKESNWIYYGGCDPSLGKVHPSAIVIGGYDRGNNKLHVIESTSKNRGLSLLESDILKYQNQYNIQAWGFENNNAYEAVRVNLIDSAARKNVVLPMFGLTASAPLDVRIGSLEPFISGLEPTILIHSQLTTLQNHLTDYPEKDSTHHYDDLVGLYLLHQIAVMGALGPPSIEIIKKSEMNQQLEAYSI